MQIFINKPHFRRKLALHWLWRFTYSYALAFIVINAVAQLLNRQGAEPIEFRLELIVPAIPVALVFFACITIYRILSKRLQTILIYTGVSLILVPPTMLTLALLLSPGKANILSWFISAMIVGGIYYVLWGRALLIALGQYNLAIGNINLWMRLRPGMKANLCLQRANCHFSKQDFESVYHDLEQALMLAPYNFKLLSSIALFYIEMGDYQLALDFVESKLDSLELPGDVEFDLLNVQIWIYLLLSDYETAHVLCDVLEIEFPKMLLHPSYEGFLLYKQGFVSLLMDNYIDALIHFETALSTSGNSIRQIVLLGLAATYYRLDNLHKSEEMWFKMDIWYPQWDIEEYVSLKSTIPAIAEMVRASYEAAH